MSKRLLLALTALIATYALGQEVKHFEVNVGDFKDMAVTDNINVTYESDPQRAGMVVFDCAPEIGDNLLLTSNVRGKLTIQLNSAMHGMAHLPTLHVYSSELTYAENAGDSTLTLRNIRCPRNLKVMLCDNGRINVQQADVNQLDLSLMTGKGVITASGRCLKLQATVLGKGSIDALEVVAQEIRAHMMGVGVIDVDASEAELYVRGSGTGRINYLGKPRQLKVRKLGPLKVNQLDP